MLLKTKNTVGHKEVLENWYNFLYYEHTELRLEINYRTYANSRRLNNILVNDEQGGKLRTSWNQMKYSTW